MDATQADASDRSATPRTSNLNPAAESPFSADYEELLAIRVTKRSLLYIGSLAAIVLGVAGAFGYHMENEISDERKKLIASTAAAEQQITGQVDRARVLADSLHQELERSKQAATQQQALFGQTVGVYQSSLMQSMAAASRTLGNYDARMQQGESVMRTVNDSLSRVSKVRDSIMDVVRDMRGHVDGYAARDSVARTVASAEFGTLAHRVGDIESQIVGSTAVVLTAGNPVTVYGMDLKIKFRGLDDNELTGLSVIDVLTGRELVHPRTVRIGNSVAFATAEHTYRITARYRAKHRLLGRAEVGLQLEQFGPPTAKVADGSQSGG